MIRLSLLLLAALMLPELVQAESPTETPPAGRYQITSSFDGLYFLDTATGALWFKTNSDEWRRVESPVNRPPQSIVKSKGEEVPFKEIVLELPKEGKTMPMVQREKRAIPGSSESLFLQIGDITAGQVFVEVVDSNGKQIAERTSLKHDEYLKFEIENRKIYLHVIELINNFASEDICKIHFSYKKPKIEPKAERPTPVEVE